MSGYSVRKVELDCQSEGPDYFTTGEFQVVLDAIGAIVARFPWTLDEPYLTNKAYSGPHTVKFSDDGTEVIAISSPIHEQRVLLPHATGPITVTGVSIGSGTDFQSLARDVAANEAPPDASGWREPGGQWLANLYRRLGQTPMARELARGVDRLLDSRDSGERACALRFYYHAGDEPGAVAADRWRSVLDACQAAGFEDTALVARQIVRAAVATEQELLEYARTRMEGPCRDRIERALTP
jgi:hypothetical protein